MDQRSRGGAPPDVELTVTDGMLHIEAERREEDKKEGKGYVR